MSVLIPGMEMPSCCGLCPFQASRWTGDFCTAGQFMMPTDFDYHDIHEKCPLVWIKTPHGNLIDRSKIGLTDFEIAMFNGDFKEALLAYIGKVEDAPVVVEAEGSEKK